MSRNMLPFQGREALRYGPSAMLARLALLRRLQQRSFRNGGRRDFPLAIRAGDGPRTTGPLPGGTAVIPHGVGEQFVQSPRPQRRLPSIRPNGRCESSTRRLSTSTSINGTSPKPRPDCGERVCRSRSTSWETLSEGRQATCGALRRLDPQGTFLTVSGPIEHAALPDRYHAADVFVFASSCENLPNILLEAMAAGLPIACSSRGPMPEILGTSGLYFDPLRPKSLPKRSAVWPDEGDFVIVSPPRPMPVPAQFSWEPCSIDVSVSGLESGRDRRRAL